MIMDAFWIIKMCLLLHIGLTGKAAAISRHLIDFMNRDDPKRGAAKFQYLYLAEEQKSRFIIWGSPAFVGMLLSEVAALAEG